MASLRPVAAGENHTQQFLKALSILGTYQDRIIGCATNKSTPIRDDIYPLRSMI